MMGENVGTCGYMHCVKHTLSPSRGSRGMPPSHQEIFEKEIEPGGTFEVITVF